MTARQQTEERNQKTSATYPMIARCGCGRTYGPAEWAVLPKRGVQHIPACGGEPEEDLELADCVCRSTISRRLP
jgi:hypothetical protein